jgi:hypothetical protein
MRMARTAQEVSEEAVLWCVTGTELNAYEEAVDHTAAWSALRRHRIS